MNPARLAFQHSRAVLLLTALLAAAGIAASTALPSSIYPPLQFPRVVVIAHAGTLPGLSIEENMALAMDRGRRRGLRLAVTAHRRARMRQALEVLGLGLENRLSDSVSLLSAGQRLQESMDELAAMFVRLIADHVVGDVGEQDLGDLTETLARLRPGAQVTVEAGFARAMDRQVRAVIDQLLGRLATP